MTFITSSTRMGEALERARQHWRNLPTVGEQSALTLTKPKITIAISREAGARGTTLANKVGQLLGWPVYNRELLKHISETSGLKLALLESVDEKCSSWLEDCMDRLLATPHISQATYARNIMHTVMSLSALGNCIIVGRGAAQILPPETALRVRLVGPENERIAYVQRKFALPENEATKWVRDKDRERTEYICKTFLKNVTDPTGYDLTLNMSRIPVEVAADIVREGVKAWQERLVTQQHK